MEQLREVVFYKHYFEEFVSGLSPKVQDKIDYVLFLVTHAERVPEKFLKHIEAQKGLYEIRVEVSTNIYRIFCCFDKGKLVVLFNGFQKKTRKTPAVEIEFALKLMREYFHAQKPTKLKAKKNITTLEQHLTKRHGSRGTVKRTEFEIKAKAFMIGEIIKEERRLANMTQEQLADKIGVKKSFISRIENGKSDIQLSTLYRLLELGLGRKVDLVVH